MKRILVMVAASAALAGCTLGPSYVRPDTAVPGGYAQPAPAGEAIANVPWWQLFQDPELQRLVEAGLKENKDLGIAAARIDEARARLGVRRADQFPTATASAGAGRGRSSDYIVPDASVENDFVVAGQVAFEVDLWGKYRRATESARAELLASEEARRVVLFTLVSDIASLYFQLRDLDAKVEITRRTLGARRESLRLASLRFEGGVVPQLDVRQAEIEEATTEAELPAYERQIAEVERALNLLLGRFWGPIPRGKPLDGQVLPPEVPAGLPSELLERRPDVRQAEQALHAQMALIGVAEALRFPTFSLTAALGLESTHFDDLFRRDARLWNFGGNFLQTLFDFGKNKQRVEVEKARTQQAVLQYQKTVQQAVGEVETSLVAIRSYRKEREVQLRRVGSASGAAKLAQARYDGGVTTYLEVLDAERSLYSAEIDASAA
ncbi:MAG: efflux transporter outer membrane subunit, partial [Deltaproteobacteria bacterium]|nr:efflux transporter outer membrane subunit [Deltaproteobacteria bacterium]